MSALTPDLKFRATETQPLRPAYPSAARAWSFVLVLAIASIVSVIDRAILNIVVDPVRASLGLSDVQIALLQGLAFGLFYAAVGIPLGMTADRISRRRLVAAGMLVWSAATIAGGLAHGFGSFFISRLLIGLGEATLGPAAISLIGDLFPPAKRGRPISIFVMGQAVAFGLSISVAGSILHAAKAGMFQGIPLLSGLEPWRILFIGCGLPGLLVVGLLLLTREPARQTAATSHDIGSQFRACVAYFNSERAIYVPFYLGFALCFMAAYAAGAWTPTMLMRGFGVTPGRMAESLGPLSLLCGILGPLLGGLLADAQADRRLFWLGLAPLLALPGCLAVFAPGASSAIVLVATLGGVPALIGTLTFAAMQSMVPPNMRGAAVAISGLVNTLIGATLGPLLVATCTQHVFGRPDLVGYAIAVVTLPGLLGAAVCFSLSWRALRRRTQNLGHAF
jgi:MFS family permease